MLKFTNLNIPVRCKEARSEVSGRALLQRNIFSLQCYLAQSKSLYFCFLKTAILETLGLVFFAAYKLIQICELYNVEKQSAYCFLNPSSPLYISVCHSTIESTSYPCSLLQKKNPNASRRQPFSMLILKIHLLLQHCTLYCHGDPKLCLAFNNQMLGLNPLMFY